MDFLMSYIIVFIIGAFVGIAELLSRYRDEPFKVLFSAPGLFYLLVNACASVFALFMIDAFEWRFGIDEDSSQDALRAVQVLCGGFGAIALFRSALFTIRIDGNDVNVGPNAFLQIMLSACDRAVDRNRASSRAAKVVKIMKGLDFDQVKTDLPVLCFGFMQNLEKTTQETVAAEILALDEDVEMKNEVKLVPLGLSLMNVVGENVLQAAVDALKETEK